MVLFCCWESTNPTFNTHRQRDLILVQAILRQQLQPERNYRSHLKFQPDNGGTIPNARLSLYCACRSYFTPINGGGVGYRPRVQYTYSAYHLAL